MTRLHWLLLVAAVGPVVFGLSNQIHDFDPSQYAEVARRMLASHEWLDLRDSSGPFTNKPPVTMWAQAAVMAVVGVTSFAARFPILLFGLLAVFATFVAGKELWDARTGALAAIGVGGSVAFQHMVADPKVDMPLLAFSAVSIAALLVSRRRPAMVWLAWVAAGLAVLSKGPLGLVLPMAAVGPELIRPSWLPGTSLWQRFAAMKLVRGLLIVVAIAAPFYVVMGERSGREAAFYLLVRQGFGRLTGNSGWNDDTTPLFFFHTAAWAFFPITMWLVVALVRRGMAMVRARALPGSVERVAVWWLVIPFMAISVSTYKLPQYVYWLVAPAALLGARELALVSERAARRWTLGAAVFGVVAVGAVAASRTWLFPVSAWWLLTVTVLPAGLGWAIRRAPPPERALGAWLAVSTGVFVFFHASFHRSLLEFQPGEAMAAEVRLREPNGTAVLAMGATPTHSLPYYAQRDIEMVDPARLREILAQQGARTLVVAPEVGDEFLASEHLAVTNSRSFPSFQTSIPSRWFLLASTRPEVLLNWRVVTVHVAP